MLLIRKNAFARAGLIGNPSDGYSGKTISLAMRDYGAEVTLYEWDQIEVVFARHDQSRFDSVDDLACDVRLHGYYGGVRLVKATIKKFVEFCRRWGYRLHNRNFAVRYDSNIPRQVGLAGSSAIIVATLRCLMEFYELQLPLEIQPSLALSVETEELGISAGLQDRVSQVYEGVVHMDFSPEATLTEMGLVRGTYRRLDPSRLPLLYVAFSLDDSEPTEIIHNNLRSRYESGDPAVVGGMQRLKSLTDDALASIESGDHRRLAFLINENFDIRRAMCRLSASHVRMVEIARSVGASAKFAGSGGAIIGTYEDDTMLAALREKLGKIGCRVFRPDIG